MRFPSRVKVGVSLLALFALAGSFMLYGLFSRGNPTHAAGVQSFGATTGRLTPFAVVDPKSLTMTSASTAPGSTHPKGARHYRPTTNASAHAAQTGTSSQLSSTGTLLQGFNGVSSHDSGITNFGAEFEPPDQGLCVGNNFVVRAGQFGLHHLSR